MFPKYLIGLLVLGLVLSGAVYAYANPAAVPLGASGNYVVLAETTVTTTGTTAIIGDLGLSNAVGDSAYVGFGQVLDGSGQFSTSSLVTGKLYAYDYANPTPSELTTAVTNMGTAYTNGAGRTADLTNTNGGNLGGLTLVRGVYAFNGASGNVIINGGDLILTGGADDVWIFQIEGTLDCSSDVPGRSVVLTGGAQAQNVFWIVAGATTLHPGCNFNGIILDQTNIAQQSGATFNGRALSQTAVTLISNNVSLPVIIAPVPQPLSNSSLNVTGCLEVNTPGIYRMNTSLVGAPIPASPLTDTVCVKIVSSNVLFDCNNFAITNNGTGGTTYGMLVTNTSTNVSVYNCPGISQYSYGVVLYNSNNTNFVNLVTYDNSVNGFFANNSANTTVSGSVSHNNGGGFQFTSTVGGTNSLTNVTAHDSLGNVFEFTSTGANILTNCIAADNAGSAFFFNTTGSNTLAGDRANNNLDAFTIIMGGPSNTFSNTLSFNNTGAGTALVSSNATMTATHYYNNNPDFSVSGSGNVINLSGVVFDSPSGLYTNYTNLSVSDVVGASYAIDHSTAPAPLPTGLVSFAGKFVDVTDAVNINQAVWAWQVSEVMGYNPYTFQLWLYNGSNWTLTNSTLNVPLRTIVYPNIGSFGVFAILANASNMTNATDNGNEGNPSSRLSISISSSCSANIVTVSNGGPVNGATVVMDGNIIGTTNSSGQVSFSGCGSTPTIYARADGYLPSAHEQVTLVDCIECQSGCTSDSQCPANQRCDQQCVPVPCTDGQVVNHECVPNPVEENETQCTPPSCCSANAQCGDSQACVTPTGAPATSQNFGSCQQVTGQCGQVQNHVFVPYACGTGADCPTCSSGQVCVDNLCVPFGVTCQSTGTVGTTVTCQLTRNNQPCANCNATITAPDGTKTTLYADSNGNIQLALSAAGLYQVSNGPSTIQVSASKPTTAPTTPTTPTTTPPTSTGGLDPFCWGALIVVALVIGGLVYYRSTMKPKV